LDRAVGGRSLGSLEAVTGAAHRLKIARVLRVGFDFFADAADVDVDGTRGDVGSVAPDGVEKMIAGKNAAEVAGEVIQQAKFGGGGGNGLPSNREDHGGGVDGNFSDGEGSGGKGALEAAQHGFDPGHEFARAEGFRDIVVGAKFETENTIGLAAFCGQENDGNGGEAGSLANGAAEFESVFAGNHDVENEEGRALAFGVGDHVGADGVDADGEAVILQVVADEAGDIGIVFDNEDGGLHGFIVAKGVAGT